MAIPPTPRSDADEFGSASALRAVDRPYACQACGTRYRTPEHAAGCEDDHSRSDVTDEECTEERPCKACMSGIRDLGYSLYDEPEEVRLAVHGTPWVRRAPNTVDVAKLRELAGALNRIHARQPLAQYTGFGDAILEAIGEPPGYMGALFPEEEK